VNRDPAHRGARELHLAGVQSGSDLEPEAAHGVHDCPAGADRPRRPVERRQESVAGSVDLSPAKPLEVATDELMMVLEQVAPTTIAELASSLRRPDNVGEQHGR